MKYNVNELPQECYTVRPIHKGLLKVNEEVPVTIVSKACTGYYPTNLYVSSVEQLKEMNMVSFGISDDNVRQIMQDYSVMGNWGLLNFLNKKEVA